MATLNTKRPISLPELQLRVRSFCERQPIEKLEVFGSVARETENPGSDVDLLATFAPNLPTGLDYFGFVQGLENELADLLGCEVDLLDRASVEASRNPIRRHEILARAKVIYERGA